MTVINFGKQPVTYEQLVEKGKQAVKKQQSMNWEIGDLAADVESEYGGASLQRFAEDIGVSFDAIRACISTTRAWPQIGTRVTFWAVHRVLNAHPDRVKIITENPSWTVRQATAFMHAGRPPAPRPLFNIPKTPVNVPAIVETPTPVKPLVEQAMPPAPTLKEPIWTAERDAMLIQLTKQGMADPQIAEALGTTAGAVSGRRVRINFKNFNPTERRMSAVMPDDILLQALARISVIRVPMYELDDFSLYADQMHDDAKHRIAEEVEVFYNLSRDIIKRLVGGIREIKPVACGVELKV